MRRAHLHLGLVVVSVLTAAAGCGDDGADTTTDGALADSDAGPASDGATAGADAATTGRCPVAMTDTGSVCMDLHEAPNQVGAVPLVMYSFDEAEAWCGARGKRLCFDDEWTAACAGAAMQPYPYGTTRVAGRCNDDKVWRVYAQSRLNGWPAGVSLPAVDALPTLLTAVRARGAAAADAATHIEELYQGEAAGLNPQCVGAAGAFDLVGNVEEWTRRRSGGMASFHGALKGRYWAEARTCQSTVTTHGDGFRFYEIGFRCCQPR